MSRIPICRRLRVPGIAEKVGKQCTIIQIEPAR